MEVVQARCVIERHGLTFRGKENGFSVGAVTDGFGLTCGSDRGEDSWRLLQSELELLGFAGDVLVGAAVGPDEEACADRVDIHAGNGGISP